MDQRAAIDIDVGIRCFAEYSYHIANPLLFYTNVCGNVSEDYDRSEPRQPTQDRAAHRAPARVRESAKWASATPRCPAHVRLADAFNEALSAKWRDLGIKVVSAAFPPVTANEKTRR